MKTVKKKVNDYLKNETLFRERKNKYKGIVNLLMRDHTILNALVEEYGDNGEGKKRVINLFIEFMTMNRWWNKLLKDNPELRGKDYNDKIILEQQKQIELGYEAGYYQDIKRLKKLQ